LGWLGNRDINHRQFNACKPSCPPDSNSGSGISINLTIALQKGDFIMKKYLALLSVIFSILLTACSAQNQMVSAATISDPIIIEKEAVVAEGDLLPSPSVELAFLQSGMITDLLVSTGDVVQQGTVLATLQGYENAKAQVEEAKLNLKLAQQVVDEMQRNSLSNDIFVYQNYLTAQENFEKEANRWSLSNREKATELELLIDDYIDANEQYQDARDELEKYDHENATHPLRENAQESYDEEVDNLHQAYQDLLQQIPDNQSLLSDKEIDILLEIGNLESVRNQLNRLDNGLDVESYAIANNQLDAAKQAVVAAEEILSTYTITSPISGSVYSVSDINIGDQVLPGQPVIFVANNQQWIVETIDLAEIDITRVQVGGLVTIKLDGIPNETFTGKVMDIDAIGHDYLGDNTYQVTISMDKTDSRFMWNMTATVTMN
jgi:HlyD family secretion protein